VALSRERRRDMQRFKNAVFTRRIAMLLVVLMGVFSVVPRLEASFVSSDESFASDARQNDMATVQKVLEQKVVKERLKALGYTEEEINSRLDQLSDAEIHQFATQLDSLTSGGSAVGFIIGVLVIVLLILLILHLTDKKIIIG
jgi:hypothetical protein